MLPTHVTLDLSGERFTVTYRLTGDEDEARIKAKAICVEQTVEFPVELLPAGDIATEIVGRLESFEAVADKRFEAVISYAAETASCEFPQLLNVVFGNISLLPGIRVEKLELPAAVLDIFQGPRFGRAGIRALLHAPHRPLLSTALKPMGLSAQQLADLAYQFALGGVDIIKDDHGLSNQMFAPFQKRVERCAEAVNRANQETGGRCLYMPNITAQAGDLTAKALICKESGAGGLLMSPGLTGLDIMRSITTDDRINLPMMSHPTFQGSFVTHPDNGIAHGVLFGQLTRLAGADLTVYPNFGGRFSFTRAECQQIAQATALPMGTIKPSFPTPGGGMRLESIPDMLEVYGREVVFLVGGALYRRGPDLVENCRYFRALVEGA